MSKGKLQTLKQLRGKLRRLELIQNPTAQEQKEIGWVKQCIASQESEVMK